MKLVSNTWLLPVGSVLRLAIVVSPKDGPDIRSVGENGATLEVYDATFGTIHSLKGGTVTKSGGSSDRLVLLDCENLGLSYTERGSRYLPS